ncbi:hypothetical protein D9M72_625150 [compost metagenome]
MNRALAKAFFGIRSQLLWKYISRRLPDNVDRRLRRVADSTPGNPQCPFAPAGALAGGIGYVALFLDKHGGRCGLQGFGSTFLPISLARSPFTTPDFRKGLGTL